MRYGFGEKCNRKIRKINGSTDPAKAEEGTIRNYLLQVLEKIVYMHR